MTFLPNNSVLSDFLRPHKYLPESIEFFDRASVTDTMSKRRVDALFRGLKTLGLWDYTIAITGHSDMGGLHQFGGAPLRSNTPWTVTGDATVTDDGILATGYVTNAYSFPHSLRPTAPQQTAIASIAANPVFVIGAWSQDYSNTVQSGRIYVAGGPSVDNYTLVGTYSGTGGYGDYVTGINQYGVNLVTYSDPPQYRTRNRPTLLGAWLHNGPQFGVNLVNGSYDRRANAGINQGTNNLKFNSGATSTEKGRIHFAMLAFCDPNAVGGKVVWQRLYALLNSTIWSHKRVGGHLRVQLGGQSNAAPELATYLNRDNFCENNTRCSEVFIGQTGGVAITEWVGTGTPTRTSTYQTHYWKGDGTGVLELSRPLPGIGVWREWIIWFQGESDSETDALTAAYLNRLQSLIQFWRQDTGNPDLRVLIVQIGYYKDYRTNSSIGNFVMSGLTGSYTGLNGTWTIQGLTNPTDSYVWTSGTNTLQRNGANWEITNAGGNVLFRSSGSAVEHPCLVSSWTALLGTGTPTIGSSRTGRIETIRWAQKRCSEIVGNAYTIDAKNYEYSNSDTAHMTTAGRVAMAAAMKTLIESTP